MSLKLELILSILFLLIAVRMAELIYPYSLILSMLGGWWFGEVIAKMNHK